MNYISMEVHATIIIVDVIFFLFLFICLFCFLVYTNFGIEIYEVLYMIYEFYLRRVSGNIKYFLLFPTRIPSGIGTTCFHHVVIKQLLRPA
jgi:hypothetical protein